MKKIFNILAVSFFMIGMIACDQIEEGDYFKNNSGGGTEPPVQGITKNVLLEDYTGVKCKNCPNAALLALELQKQYGHQLVVLGVHAGGLSSPQPGDFPDFLTDEGTEWFSYFNFSTNPIGTVNRKRNGSGYAFGVDEWHEAILAELNKEATVEMTSEISYNDATRDLEVKVSSKFVEEMPQLTYNLTVCIMEDSIVGKQINAPDPNNYTHRHVFRGTMNGTWGETINGSSESPTVIAPNDVFDKTYTMKLDDAFNEDQCYIVAYLFDYESKEILQVIEKKIK